MPNRRMRRAIGWAAVAACLLSPLPAHASSAPSNGDMAFVSGRDGNEEIYVMHPNGQGQTRITVDGGTDADPDWSPDGSRIAFASDRSGQFDIYSVDPSGGGLARFTGSPGVQEAAPDWSPAGQAILVSATGARSGIGVVTRAGLRGLVHGAAQTPVWSPDRKRIAFVSNFESPPLTYWLYVMNADGSGLRRLDAPDAWDIDPAWSPDGSVIAFSSDQDPTDGDFEIYAIRPDGTGLRAITDNFTDEFGPAWSPDSAYIAFHSDRNPKQPNFDILVMNADGTGEVQITSGVSDDFLADWQGVA